MKRRKPKKMTGAAHNRGASKQDYETPWELIRSVEARFGPLSFDLAASPSNAKAPKFFTEHDDALSRNWSIPGLLWLNPPFGNIAPWAKKCSQSRARIAFLVPASVGANWYRDFVHKQALILFLNGRIDFIPGEPYPKDCMIAMFGLPADFECWTWRPRAR